MAKWLSAHVLDPRNASVEISAPKLLSSVTLDLVVSHLFTCIVRVTMFLPPRTGLTIE